MEPLQLKHAPIAETGMLIRKPVEEVFEAFINPDITTKFWFTKSSGQLEAGTQVTWEWEMYDISVRVMVKAVEPNQRILIEWRAFGDLTDVEWTFTAYEGSSTFVAIRNSGFAGDGDQQVKQAADSGQGFSWVLAGLKALLEYNVRLDLVRDRFPKGVVEH